MIEIPITYKDFTGEEVTEVHTFNLSRAELIERVINEKNGQYEDMEAKIKAIQQSQKGADLLVEFKAIVSKAWGQRSTDRRKFYKDETGWRDFVASGAYDELFLMLTTNEGFAADFINGIMPANINDTPGQPGVPQASQPQPPSAPQVDNRLASEIRADEARARSEAAMQGHRPPQQREPETIVQQAPTPQPAQPIEVGPDETQASPPIQQPAPIPAPPKEYQPGPIQPYNDPRTEEDIRNQQGPGYIQQ